MQIHFVVAQCLSSFIGNGVVGLMTRLRLLALGPFLIAIHSFVPADVRELVQLVLHQVGCSLWPRGLGFEVALLVMHFVELVV
jgi:hypothetical protein